MDLERIKPGEIETRSFEIITEELGSHPALNSPYASIIKRAIHTSADFEYADNLCFQGVESGLKAIKQGACIVTDTNMTLAGINKKVLKEFGCEACCFMAEEEVAIEALKRQVTRAVVSMERARDIKRPLIFAIGNAPTALLHLCEMIKTGEVSPELVIGVPVGFVNVVQSKEMLMETKVPYITAKGRKGGSTIAAAICNALLYMLSKEDR